ncbi:MAG: four helix bundle protein [bacterium]|nr:four helix bundle protein [bacterium]
MIKHFYDLEVWKIAHKLRIEVYEFTKKFPAEERYAVIDQIRRAAASICANIAEGFGRYHYTDKIKFYYNARGSACEVQDFIFLSRDLGYIDTEVARKIFSEYEQLNKKINNFIKSVGNTN